MLNGRGVLGPVLFMPASTASLRNVDYPFPDYPS